MKRSTFLALLLSPLVAPFIPSAKEHKVVYPNGSVIWWNDPGDGLPAVTNAALLNAPSHLDDAYGYYLGSQLNKECQKALSERAISVKYHINRINRINRITT